MLYLQKRLVHSHQLFLSSSSVTATTSSSSSSSLLSVQVSTTQPEQHLEQKNEQVELIQALPHSSQPLGHPLPCDEHACSVSLPTWGSVVGYEEGDKRITDQLKCGYPRFVYHPYVLQLMETVLERYSTPTIPPNSTATTSTTTTSDSTASEPSSSVTSLPSSRCYVEDCLVLPSKVAALRCQSFLQVALQEYKIHQVLDNALIQTPVQSSSSSSITSLTSAAAHCKSRIRIIEWNTILKTPTDTENDDDDDDTIYAVLFPATTMGGMQAKAYWQHTGEIVSSRRAERALTNLQIPLQKYITTNKIAYHPAFFNHSNTTSTPIAITSTTTMTTTATTSGSASTKDSHKSNSTIGIYTNNTKVYYNPTIPNYDSSSPHDDLRTNIANWAGIHDPEYVFLTPSGMSSIYTALRTSRRYQLLTTTTTAPLSSSSSTAGGDNININSNNNGGTSIVFGFPYLDTLKLCSRPELSPGGVEFFGRGCVNDIDNLQSLLSKTKMMNNYTTTTSTNNNKTKKQQSYSALFTEVPSNPLLQCPDLIRLRQLADEYNFCLIVDDTISNFLNVDVLTSGIADAVCTSLTKLISGRGDAMAGSIVCNPYTEKGRRMKQDLVRELCSTHTNRNNRSSGFGLHESDARAILYNSYDFIERNTIINNTAVQLAEWFHSSSDCPDIDTVYYPKLNPTSVQHYHHVMRRQNKNATNNSNYNNYSGMAGDGGYGGLMSITLHPHMCQRYFYDALDIAKGPSLGTNFTLVCPYTLLAHYHELDFAMGYNVPPNLLRIAVGLEPLEKLQDKFYNAFQASRLYPKPTQKQYNHQIQQNLEQQQRRSFTTMYRSTFDRISLGRRRATDTPTLSRLFLSSLIKRKLNLKH